MSRGQTPLAVLFLAYGLVYVTGVGELAALAAATLVTLLAVAARPWHGRALAGLLARVGGPLGRAAAELAHRAHRTARVPAPRRGAGVPPPLPRLGGKGPR